MVRGTHPTLSALGLRPPTPRHFSLWANSMRRAEQRQQLFAGPDPIVVCPQGHIFSSRREHGRVEDNALRRHYERSFQALPPFHAAGVKRKVSGTCHGWL